MQLTPALLRAAILRDGCLLVRGLIPREAALDFAGQIDRALRQRDRHDGGQPARPRLLLGVRARRRSAEMARPWVKQGGGVLSPDAPTRPQTARALPAAGLPELRRLPRRAAADRLQKTTLRKAEPSVPGAWHQDGKFMGTVRALNLWLSLSRCGDESPGLDIVPRRLGPPGRQTEEAMLRLHGVPARGRGGGGRAGILRPIFEPGDALFFDELFLHKTGSDPAMPKPRFAIESWFFGASAFPRGVRRRLASSEARAGMWNGKARSRSSS